MKKYLLIPLLLFLFFIFCFISHTEVMAMHPHIYVSVYKPDGTPINRGSAVGFYYYADKSSTICRSKTLDNTRFLEIGKVESLSGTTWTFPNSSVANRGYFYPWDAASDAAKDALQALTVNVPGLGIKKRSARGGPSQAYGCNEDPIFFHAYIEGYDCEKCIRYDNFQNSGTYYVNVTCTPLNTAPTVSTDMPPVCTNQPEYTFSVRADDANGLSDITQMTIRLKDDTATDTWIANITHAGANHYATLDDTGATKFRGSLVFQAALCYSYVCNDNGQLLVKFRLRDFHLINGQATVKVKATDSAGATTGWVTGGSFYHGGAPTVDLASNGTVDPANQTIDIGWAIYGNDPSVTAFTADCYKNVAGGTWGDGTCSCSTIPLPTQGTQTGTVTCDWSAGGEGPYKFRLTGTNICGTNTDTVNIDVYTADPWLMTSGGDSYSYAGFTDLELQDVSGSFGVPTGYAYFSTFINSRDSGSWIVDGRNTRRDYILGASYGDRNRSIVGATAEIFSFLSEVAGKNGCVVSDTLPASGGCPDGAHVYMIDNPGATTTISGDWLNQAASADRACIIVTNGNLQIAAGANDPDQVDAFFLVDDEFSTASDSQVLVINGSVIADTVNFGRDLLDNSVNPAEIIRYDPKYLDLLRECLGEKYEFVIKEYKYSTPR